MSTIDRRISPDGVVRYRVRVPLNGARTVSKTFQRRTDAQKWAQKIEVAIRQDQYAITPMSRRKTLGDLIDRYVLEVLPRKPKTATLQKRQLRSGAGNWATCFYAQMILSARPTLCRRKVSVAPHH